MLTGVDSKVGERMAKIEETTKGHSRRIEKLENNHDLLTRLTILSEMQEERNERQDARDIKQDEQMEKFNTTLTKVNENLTNLNHTSDELKNNVGQLGSRISSIEATQEESKISVPKLMAKVLVGIVMLIPMILGVWLLIQMGLK